VLWIQTLGQKHFSFIVFFNGNECGSSSFGSDVYTNRDLTHSTPFLSCYSTRIEEGNKRCYLYSSSSYTNKSDWLNNASSPFSLYFNEEEGGDSYGCGIDRVFPCYSEGHAESVEINGVTKESVDEASYKEKEIFIKEEGGEEGKKCGIKEKPCFSLDEEKKQLKRAEKGLSFLLLESLSISSSYSNDNDLTIKSYLEEERDENNNNSNERRMKKKKKNDENPPFSLSLVNGDSSIIHNSLSCSFFSLILMLNVDDENSLSSLFFLLENY
jgi:hypothetical protein